MENLLTPDFGLMIWTVIVFVLLALVVGRFGWGPIVRGLQEREEGIREAVDGAAADRQEAERLRTELQKQISESQTRMQELMKQAQVDAQKVREQILQDTKSEAARLTEQTRKQLEEERAKMMQDLRHHVAGLSIQIAEKLLQHSMTTKENEAMVQGVLNDIDQKVARN